MKAISNVARLVTLCVLTAGTSVIGMQVAKANPPVTTIDSDAAVPSGSADQLGNLQSAQGISSTLNQGSQEELPTFRIKNESSRPKGILGVLGGRFVNEDRHPSFRKSTIQR